MTRLSIIKGKSLLISSMVICLAVTGFVLYDKNICHTCEGRNLSKNIIKSLKSDENIHTFEGATFYDTEKFFDEYLFQKGLSKINKQEDVKEKIHGAVVPHHLIPSFMIADIFYRISEQDVDTVILLAPNHQNIGDTPVLTSKLAWNTPYGKIMSNDTIFDILTQKDYISINEKVLNEEHAVGSLVPFIAYYNNNVRIVPIVLRQDMTKEQIRDLSESIVDVISDKIVVVASVDFSHYLNSLQAEENDTETLRAIKEKDYNELLQMNSDYLDSPEAIVILLQIMEQLNVKSSEVLYNTNSGRLMDDLFTQTTSYFSMIFTK